MTPSFSIAAVPLWLAPVLLLAFAAALLALGRTDAKSPRWAVFAPLLSLLVLAPGARDAWAGSTVLTFGPRLARVGQADLGLGLALDRTSLVVAAGICVAWTAAMFLGTEKQRATSSARSLAILAAVVTGVLADGFPTLLLAALVVLLLTPIAADAPRAALGRFFGLASAAVLAVALGSALLFWALGGRWLDGMQYLADYNARFVVAGAKVEAEGEVAKKPDRTAARLGSPTAQGTLTMVTHPGAKIYDGVADEAQLARSVPIAVSPAIQVPILAGLHKIAIAPGDAAVVSGDGLEVALIDVVEIREGKDTVVVIAGPTMTFHEIAPQIGTGEAFVKRRLSSVPAAAAIAAAFLASLLLAAFALRERFDGLTGALAGSGLFCVLSIATARVGVLVITTPVIGIAFAVAAAASALVWALPALRGGAHSRTGVLAPIAALGTAAAASAPAAPASAAAAISLAVALLALEPAPAVAAQESAAAAPKKKKKKQSAETPAEPEKTPAASLTSPASLVRAAASGVPLPGGVFVLGATGVACAFAGMGAGNALMALTVVVAWVACAAIVWRSASKDSTPWISPIFGAVALVLGLATAVALAPWDVPANVSRDVRAGLALVAFGIVTAAALRVRSLGQKQGPPSSEPKEPAEPAAVLSLVGRTIDRAIGAPLDLLVLPFSRRATDDADKKESAS